MDGKLILLIDDDIASVAAARRALTAAGFEPVLASNVADAEAVVLHDEPALVILSLATDGGSGLSILDAIREQADDPALPIILIGDGRGPVTDLTSALIHGADGYFERPVDWKQVVAKVESYLGARQAPMPDSTEGLAELEAFDLDAEAEAPADGEGTPAAEAPATEAVAPGEAAGGGAEEEEGTSEAEAPEEADEAAEAADGASRDAPGDEVEAAWAVHEPGRPDELADELFGDLEGDEEVTAVDRPDPAMDPDTWVRSEVEALEAAAREAVEGEVAARQAKEAEGAPEPAEGDEAAVEEAGADEAEADEAERRGAAEDAPADRAGAAGRSDGTSTAEVPPRGAPVPDTARPTVGTTEVREPEEEASGGDEAAPAEAAAASGAAVAPPPEGEPGWATPLDLAPEAEGLPE
ncbi:MAG: DNA-binding response regulator, partial [Deltaproteobacteria bacterium]